MDKATKQQWSEEETQCFLEQWSSSEVQHRLEGAARTKPVFESIRRKMAAAGFDRTVEQIVNKLKKLKKDYRDHMKESKHCCNRRVRRVPHFELLHSILGDGSARQTTGVLSSATGALSSATGAQSSATGARSTGALNSATASDMHHSAVEKLVGQMSPDIVNPECAPLEDEVEFGLTPEEVCSSPAPSSSSAAQSPATFCPTQQATLDKRKRCASTDLLEYLQRSDQRFLEQSRREEDLVKSMFQRMEENSKALICLMGRMVSVLEYK